MQNTEMKVSRKKIDVLRAMAGYRNWTELSKAAGLRRQSLQRVLDSGHDVRLSTMEKLIYALRQRGLDVGLDDIIEEDETPVVQ